MRSYLLGRTPAAPAPHPLRRVTDWPSAESRRRSPCVPARRPAPHPGRRATDRLLPAVRTRRCAVRRPRTAARRRRSRAVRARAAHARRGGGSPGSPSEPAGHGGPVRPEACTNSAFDALSDARERAAGRTEVTGRDLDEDRFRPLPRRHRCDEVRAPEALRRLDVREATVLPAGGRDVLVGTPSPPWGIRP
ncbi:hypothetical protein ACFVGW_29175 [Streptomyces sp. NPDC127129]|uniref:hypothetical protein n=1 Tax=Streptomyces sp. NPDC127129 TaxID=3345373 RepID=UPI003643D8E8